MGKKLYLSYTDRKLAGVCGGIAEYLNIDATLVRLVWVILAFTPFNSVIAYFIAWLIMPKRTPAYAGNN